LHEDHKCDVRPERSHSAKGLCYKEKDNKRTIRVELTTLESWTIFIWYYLGVDDVGPDQFAT